MLKPTLKLGVSALLILVFSSTYLGQELDQDCRPIPLPSQCQQTAAALAALEASYDDRIESLQELLRRAPTSAKAAIIRRIREVERQRSADRALARLANDLQACRQRFDTTPRRQLAPDVLNAFFNGTVETRTTRPEARGPFTQRLSLGIQFSRSRCNVTITSFPPISFNTPPVPVAGVVTVTVSQIGGGTGQFFPVSGQLVMPVTLQLAYSTIFAGNDTAAITLTTGNSVSPRGAFSLAGARLTTTNGAPVDACGTTVNGTPIQCTLTLVGTTTFQNGFLGGQEGGFTVRGNITTPLPPPRQTRQQCLAECEANYQSCMDSAVDGRPSPFQCATGRNQCRARCPSR
ncbi:MAG TPA: hypothetical protein VFZ44_01235 [Pyrinomonadaceae bacterium]